MVKRRIVFLAAFALIVLAALIVLILSTRKSEFDGTGLKFVSGCAYGY